MILRDYQSGLVQQVHDAWRAGYKRPCIVAPCGAGKTVIAAEMTRLATLNKNRVLFIAHRQELCEQTEETFQAAGVDMDYCQVGMVQTVTRRTGKMQPPSLIITDENHHCVAASYKRIYTAWPDAYGIGITATPQRLGGQGLGDVNDLLIIGPTVRELIDQGHLAPFRYFSPDVADLSGLHTRAGEFVAEEVESRLNKAAIFGDVIAHYRNLISGKQAICYCASIAHSERMAAAFQAAGIPARHIDGETPKPERAEAIGQFRAGEIRVLCNVDLISEGFDVPDCAASILLRPTQSLTLHVQQSMRCMRYQPGKTATIIDHVGNCTRHGLPDTPRAWSLEGKAKQKEQSKIDVRQCPMCYCTYSAGSACPNCGYEPPIKEREVDEVPDATLKEVVGFTLPTLTLSQCQTVQDLYKYAAERGYRPGWAWHQSKLRGWL